MIPQATSSCDQSAPGGATESIEQHIVCTYLTDFGIDQALASAWTISGADPRADLGDRTLRIAISLSWQDLLMECPSWVKRLHNPRVDFGDLAHLCARRVCERAARL